VTGQNDPLVTRSETVEVHRLIRLRVNGNSVLMNTRPVRTNVRASYRFKGRQRGSRAGKDETSERRNGWKDQPRFHGERIRSCVENGRDFLKRGVAGALPHPERRNLYLVRTFGNGGKRIRDCEREVIMAMNADARGAVAKGRHCSFQVRDKACEFRRKRVANGVRDIDDAGTGLGDGVAVFREKRDIGAGRVLSAHFYFARKPDGE
jgi:hypothetical protein